MPAAAVALETQHLVLLLVLEAQVVGVLGVIQAHQEAMVLQILEVAVVVAVLRVVLGHLEW
jgi:hypothetical protein